jgi:protein-S-isoprenylcysteine O-methyltransferase Ste14
MIYSIIYWSICLFWFVSELFLALKKRSSKITSVVPQEKSSLRWLWITIISSILVGIFWNFTLIGRIPLGRAYFYWLGILFFFLGAAVRWTAIFQLGKFFTVDVSIQKEHKIISSGLYGFVRHPSYSGSLISVFGLGLALNNWVSLLIIFLPILLAYLYRIRIEEKVLLATFGKEYEDYQKKTKRLIPKV